MTKEKIRFTVGTEPAFWDLVKQYFPDEHNDPKKYLNDSSDTPIILRHLVKTYFPPELAEKYIKKGVLKKIIEAGLWRPAHVPSYPDRVKVHQLASDLQAKNPHIKTREVYEHPDIKDIVNRYKKERTVKDWIREILYYDKHK